MTYDDFVSFNQKAKSNLGTGMKTHIDSNIKAKDTECEISRNQNTTTIKISELVKNINQGIYYVSNPSALANWDFSTGMNQTSIKYKIIAKLSNRDRIVGYRMREIATGYELDESIERIKILVQRGEVFGLTLIKGKIQGSDKVDLRRLNVIKIFTKQLSTFLIEDEISSEYMRYKNYKTRYIFNKLEKYLSSDTNKVCILYGLRRTGKTVMLLQAANYLKFKSCAYISLNQEDSILDLFKTLDHCYQLGIYNVFIDEITALNNILNCIQTLADNYTTKGMHIVVSGTYSYMLEIASHTELYGRCVKLQTSYVSFKEYNYLMGSTDIADYIHYGGVLFRDAFYDIDSTHQYLGTAISDNIEHTLRTCSRSQFGILHDMAESGELKKYIEAAIQQTNETLAVNILTDEFKSKDFGSLKELLSKKRETSFLASQLEESDIKEKIRYYLRVKNIEKNNIDGKVLDSCFDTLVSIFDRIDLMIEAIHYIGKGKYHNNIFVLPGLRYNQLIETFNTIIEDDIFKAFTKKERNLILEKLKSDVYGQLMEQVVLLSMITYYGRDKVYKFNGATGGEIDCIIEVGNDEIDLIEVKWNEYIYQEEQCRHLCNITFIEEIQNTFGYQIRKKILIYRGVDSIQKVANEDVEYINVNNFLATPKKYL